MSTTLFPGVPAILRQDGWWLDSHSTIHTTPKPENGEGRPVAFPPLLRTIAMVLLADLLLWGVAPGLSLPVFCLGLITLAGINSPRLWTALLLVLVTGLPYAEQPQFLSFLFLAFGTLGAGALIATPELRPGPAFLLAASRFGLHIPFAAVADLFRWLEQPATTQLNRPALSETMRNWTLPIGGSVVFAALFLSANPIFDGLSDLLAQLALPKPARILFWLSMTMVIWPFLKLYRMRERIRATMRPRQAIAIPALFNPGSVARALVVLNLLFGIQTLSDVAYLWAGATLPDEMNYAEYAHRGAYPLLVAALLAGLFAIIAQSHIKGRRNLRVLLFLWIAQTMLLVGSSALRLDLYVDVYGLTRLRLSAAIWMGTVLAGLGLLTIQVLGNKSVRWLLNTCTWLAMVVLYGTTFLSFDRTIARYNLTHDVKRDAYYLCLLGYAAQPDIRAFEARTREILCPSPGRAAYYTPSSDLREWGFRDWRTLRRLSTMEQSAAQSVAP